MKELNEEKEALTGEELKKVNGGICWPVKYGVDPSKPQLGVDGNNANPGGRVHAEEKPGSVDCSGLIP